jgi:group I intron endonuclease
MSKVTKGVYCITSPSGKRYVGVGMSVHGIEGRWNSYKKLNCKNQPKLFGALKKYGAENFKYEVILETDDADNAKRSEMYLIDVWNLQDDNYGYNIQAGGPLGNFGIKTSQEAKQKMRNAKLGKKASQETKKRMSLAQKGLSKQKPKGFSETISKMRKGLKLSNEHKRNISIGNIGKHSNPRSEETKKKMSESRKGKMTGIKHPNYKLRKFQNIYSGEIVECGVYEGSKIYGWEMSNIVRRSTSKGWRLIDE